MAMKVIFLKLIIVILATMFYRGDPIISGLPADLLAWLEKMEIINLGKPSQRHRMEADEHPLTLCSL